MSSALRLGDRGAPSLLCSGTTDGEGHTGVSSAQPGPGARETEMKPVGGGRATSPRMGQDGRGERRRQTLGTTLRDRLLPPGELIPEKREPSRDGVRLPTWKLRHILDRWPGYPGRQASDLCPSSPGIRRSQMC